MVRIGKYMRKVLALTILIVAAPVAAKPVYLRCTIAGAEKGFEVTLDEDRGTAAGLLHGKTVPATFTREEVSYRDSLAGILFITQKIDRRTLALTSESTIAGGKTETKLGKCEVVAAVQNKF